MIYFIYGDSEREHEAEKIIDSIKKEYGEFEIYPFLEQVVPILTVFFCPTPPVPL